MPSVDLTAAPRQWRSTRGYMSGLGRYMNEEESYRPGVTAHAKSVSILSRELASACGMGGPDLDDLTMAARVHDVGKLTTPSLVLNKNGRLDDAEWDQMRRHARNGADMLDGIEGIPRVMVDVARYHHERYDGFGYEGLQGEEIPYPARIVNVADCYDGMCEKRPYKEATPPEQVLLTMTADRPAGSQGRKSFDPVVIRRFVSLRLVDPAVVLSPEGRETLGAFAASDPNEDLSPEQRESLRIEGDGSRLTLLQGEPTTVQRTGTDGRIGPVLEGAEALTAWTGDEVPEDEAPAPGYR